jgi:hypothetical protein
MSTASITIDPVQTGTAYTNDVNAAFSALDSLHSGSTAPATELVTGKLWLDTGGANPILKIYRTGWKTLFTIYTDRASMDATSITTGDLNVNGFSNFDRSVVITDIGNTFLTVRANSSGAGNDDDASIVIDAAETGESNLEFKVANVPKAYVNWFDSSSILSIATRVGTNGSIDLIPNGSLAVRVSSAGNVGIGTSSPTSKLSVVGNTSVTGTVTATDFNTTSDSRLKDDILPMNSKVSLNNVLALQGVSYTMNGVKSIGLIAQDVEKVIPEAVVTREDGYKGVNYGNLVAELVEGMKEQQCQINEMKLEIKSLKEK